MTKPSQNPREALAARWRATMSKLEIGPEQADQLFEDIAEHYSEAHRHYHTLDHIRNLLDTMNGMQSQAENPLVVELAAWLHDVIYDPQAKDNELRSADYATALLRSLDAPPRLVTQVARLIVLTEHKESPQDQDARMLLDADLVTLGADGPTFREIGEAIEMESRQVPREEYLQGRKQFFSQFLARPRIFLTDEFYAKYEAQTRQNLKNELDRLNHSK